MIVLGIDIGVTGAVVAIGRDGVPRYADMPVIELKGAAMVRRRLSARGLMHILREFVPANEAALVVHEDVHTMPGTANSPQAGGSLLRSRGIVEAVLELARVEVKVVQPVTWKRYFGLVGKAKDKAEAVRQARAIAVRLYPDCDVWTARARDHNRVDALLMAHYGLKGL